MSTTTRKSRLLTILVIVGLVLLVLLFTGCGSIDKEPTADPSASAATAPEAEVKQTPPPVNEMIAAFGDVFTYENNVSISVSAGTPFTPSEYAAGTVDGQTALLFTIVLTNNTDAPIDPYTYESVASGGQEASAIFDFGNSEWGAIGEAPSTSVLPGGTVQWLVAYSVVDPADLIFELAPGFEYDQVIYTNRLP